MDGGKCRKEELEYCTSSNIIFACKTYVEHVLHVVHRDEGIVDGNDLDLRVVASRSHNKTTDAAETIDTNFDGPIQ